MSEYDPKLSVKENLEREVEQELRGNEKVVALLTTASKRYKEIDVLGTPVKIRPAISKAIRHYVDDIKDDPDQQTVSGSEVTTYKLLAAMCIEEPYNTPEFWKIVDDATGEAIDILQSMYRTAQDTEAQIKTFRGK